MVSISNKTIMILAIAAALVTGTLTTASVASAHIDLCAQPSVDSMKSVWHALCDLQEQINDISPGPPGPAGPPGPPGSGTVFGTVTFSCFGSPALILPADCPPSVIIDDGSGEIIASPGGIDVFTPGVYRFEFLFTDIDVLPGFNAYFIDFSSLGGATNCFSAVIGAEPTSSVERNAGRPMTVNRSEICEVAGGLTFEVVFTDLSGSSIVGTGSMYVTRLGP